SQKASAAAPLPSPPSLPPPPSFGPSADVLQLDVKPDHPSGPYSDIDEDADRGYGLNDEEGEMEEQGIGGESRGPPLPGLTTATSESLVVLIRGAGPFSARGSYRVRVVLYEGGQAVATGPGRLLAASTSSQVLDLKAEPSGEVRWRERLVLGPLVVQPTTLLLFELHVAKQLLPGLPAQEAMCAWTCSGKLQSQGAGSEGGGHQSLPLYRLPVMPAAPARFSYQAASLHLSLAREGGDTGDVQDSPQTRPADGSSPAPPLPAAAAAQAVAAAPGLEDLAGLPRLAWSRVSCTPALAQPFVPGQCCQAMVQGQGGAEGKAVRERG
ncbi:hypothetical protein QJQ45_019336, partial [Haematococcus lacustris]